MVSLGELWMYYQSNLEYYNGSIGESIASCQLLSPSGRENPSPTITPHP